MSANKKFLAVLVLVLLIFAAVLFFKFGAGSEALWQISRQGAWLLPLVTVSALLDSVNPCAFSILLLTIAFLFTLGELRAQILRLGGAYILGLFAVYLLIGLGLLQALHLFSTPHFMAKAGASLLIALGFLTALGELFPSFPVKFKIPSSLHHKMDGLMATASLSAAFALGAIVGLCEFPCTGVPYLAVLGLLHDRATWLKGLGYLLYYNLVFILPLVAILLFASNLARLERVKAWQEREKKSVRFVGGIAMVLLGIVIFFF